MTEFVIIFKFQENTGGLIILKKIEEVFLSIKFRIT